MTTSLIPEQSLTPLEIKPSGIASIEMRLIDSPTSQPSTCDATNTSTDPLAPSHSTTSKASLNGIGTMLMTQLNSEISKLTLAFSQLDMMRMKTLNTFSSNQEPQMDRSGAQSKTDQATTLSDIARSSDNL